MRLKEIPLPARYAARDIQQTLKQTLPDGVKVSVEGRRTVIDLSDPEKAPEVLPPSVVIAAPEGVEVDEAAIAAMLSAHSPEESDDERKAKKKADDEEFEEIKKLLKKRLKEIEDRLEALEKKKDKP